MRVEIPKIFISGTDDLVSNISRMIDTKLSKIHTTTIGIIQQFNAENQTAIVQPAIKQVTTTETESTIVYEAFDYPLLVNVPIIFPGGGDWFMTFPVKEGDECLIFSMESSIANWKVNGGVQDPSNYTRHLSFKDAVALVGLNSKANSLPSFNADFPEIRNRSGETKVTIEDENINITGNLNVSNDLFVEGNLNVTGSASLGDGNFTVDV